MKISRLVNDANKPFHSNGYAEVANGLSIGAASAETFQQRYRIDQNRKLIQQYRNSLIASAYDRKPVSRRPDQQTRRGSLPAATEPGFRSGSDTNAGSKLRHKNFSKPDSRHYDPYK
jgi:hypothetical protein